MAAATFPTKPSELPARGEGVLLRPPFFVPLDLPPDFFAEEEVGPLDALPDFFEAAVAPLDELPDFFEVAVAPLELVAFLSELLPAPFEELVDFFTEEEAALLDEDVVACFPAEEGEPFDALAALDLVVPEATVLPPPDLLDDRVEDEALVDLLADPSEAEVLLEPLLEDDDLVPPDFVLSRFFDPDDPVEPDLVVPAFVPAAAPFALPPFFCDVVAIHISKFQIEIK